MRTIFDENNNEITVYSVADLGRQINRTAQTIRKWELDGIIPEAKRDQVGRRIYSEEQVKAIVDTVLEYRFQTGQNIRETGFPEAVRAALREVEELTV